jgi:hypothetical protein
VSIGDLHPRTIHLMMGHTRAMDMLGCGVSYPCRFVHFLDGDLRSLDKRAMVSCVAVRQRRA